MACKTCGLNEGTVQDKNGPIVVVACNGCGTEATLLLSPGPSLKDLMEFKAPEPGEPFPL